MLVAPQDRTLMQWYLAGVLDEASGLTPDTLQGLAGELGEDMARSAELSVEGDFEQLAVEQLVRDTVTSTLEDVLEACGAEAWLRMQPGGLDRIEDPASAQAAVNQLRALGERTETVIEKAACHHAAQAAEALGAAMSSSKRDDRLTAAYHAGRVVAELIVAGARDAALSIVRSDVTEAVTPDAS